MVNGFLEATGFNELYAFLSDAAKRRDIELVVKRNCDLLFDVSGNKPLFSGQIPRFALFWDKDIRLARQLEALGITLYNSASAIELCDDKSLTHLRLARHNIPMPRTIILPMTFANIGYTNTSFLDNACNELGLPMVVKECFGSFGKQVYLAHTRDELDDIVTARAGVPLLLQELVKTSYGRDIRIMVVGGKVIAAMQRRNYNNDFRANVGNNGKTLFHTPTTEEAKLAISVCEKLGLSFGGVDILFGKDDEPLLCEVNSNAHFKGILNCTGVNAADAIMELIAAQSL